MKLAYLWSRAKSKWTKSKTISYYQTTNLLKILFLFLVSMNVVPTSWDIVHKDIKPTNSHYKSYKHEKMDIALGKKPINCELDDLGEARSVYTQTTAWTSKNCTTVIHRGSLAFMVPKLRIEELSIPSARINKLKTVDVWVVSMTFFTTLKLDQLYLFQHGLKNIPYKLTSNMKAASKQ